MKTNLKTRSGIGYKFGRALATAALLCLGAGVSQAQNSPVGLWDCVLSGNRTGTAYIEFFNDNTFSVVEVIVPNNSSSSSSSGRTSNSGGRGGPTQTPNTKGPQIFGAQAANGPWFFDTKGRVIGSFFEVSTLENCTTNLFVMSTNGTFASPDPVFQTNADGCGPNTFEITSPIATNVVGVNTNYTELDACYTNVVVCTALTNSISFIAKVTPGKKIALECSTPFGKTAFVGVPAQPLPDVSGSWEGAKRQKGFFSQEFFDLTPTGIPNTYDVSGSGPGYNYTGIAIFSSQKKAGFAFEYTPALPTQPFTQARGVAGSYDLKGNAKTHGWDQTSGGTFSDPVLFNASKLP